MAGSGGSFPGALSLCPRVCHSAPVCHCAPESDRPTGRQGQLLPAETGWAGSQHYFSRELCGQNLCCVMGQCLQPGQRVVGLLSIEMKTADE